MDRLNIAIAGIERLDTDRLKALWWEATCDGDAETAQLALAALNEDAGALESLKVGMTISVIVEAGNAYRDAATATGMYDP